MILYNLKVLIISSGYDNLVPLFIREPILGKGYNEITDKIHFYNRLLCNSIKRDGVIRNLTESDDSIYWNVKKKLQT